MGHRGFRPTFVGCHRGHRTLDRWWLHGVDFIAWPLVPMLVLRHVPLLLWCGPRWLYEVMSSLIGGDVVISPLEELFGHNWSLLQDNTHEDIIVRLPVEVLNHQCTSDVGGSFWFGNT